MSCACGKDTCGCQTPQMIHLQDHHGIVHPFYIADRLEIENRPYAFAVSLENDDQYALLKVRKSADGEDVFENITDENEWAEIQRAMSTMM